MNDLMRVATFLLAVVALSGCSTIKSMHDRIIDLQRPTIVRNTDEFIRMFEDGRRAEFKGDIWEADYMYRQLINRGCHYGEYGRAKFLYTHGLDYDEAVRCFLACASHSSNRSDFRTESDMDLAFSVAATYELVDVANHYRRPDLAKVFRGKASDLVRKHMNVAWWAHTMKTNADARVIYKDVISAVESCRSIDEYARELEWDEISKAFIREGGVVPGGAVRMKSQWSEVSFNREPGPAIKYNFEYRMEEDTSEVVDWIRSVIRDRVRKEFKNNNPNVNVVDIGISFPSWEQSGKTITGSVVAVSMKSGVVRMEYFDEPVNDGTIGHGKLVVRLGGSDMVDAIDYVTKNIKKLVNRPDIPTDGGQRRPPPDAFYKVRGQHMTEDGLLEIEFDAL